MQSVASPLGVSYLLGDTLATEQTMIQLPGEASRLRLRVLRAEFDRDDRLRMLLLGDSQLLMGHIAQGRLPQGPSIRRTLRPLASRDARQGSGRRVPFDAGLHGADAGRTASGSFRRAA